jgi:FixJ family two-component response regulator
MTDAQDVVFVVDDDEAVCRGLSRLLRSAGLTVETFASAADFVAREGYDGVGCIVLDVRMHGLDGMELQSQLAARHVDLSIVFLTGHGDIPMSVNAMKKGAFDFLTKPVDEDVLLGAVRQALERHRADRAKRLEADTLRARLETLTSREQEVLRCVISGALNKQIADYLGIAEHTVKIHRGRVMKKLGLTTVTELVNACQQAGVEPEPTTPPRHVRS